MITFFKRRKPSETLLRLIDGCTTPYELDDLLTSNSNEDFQENIVAPILSINAKYADEKYKIGLENPACHTELRELAETLKQSGL
jgi:hypothetical protein